MDTFTKKVFNFSTKNIPIPKEFPYMKDLIHETERLITRTRWKAFFFLDKNRNESGDSEDESSDVDGMEERQKVTFGFKSARPPPVIKELSNFEKDLWKLVQGVKFSHYRGPFQNKLKQELKYIKNSDKIFMQADKTRNYYEVHPSTYKKLLHENVTQNYNKANKDTVQTINSEAKDIATKFKIEDRVECLPNTDAFITLKDHKQNFRIQPKCRLINPTKSEMGIISSQILQRINEEIREKTKLRQWRKTQDTIDWFKSIENKRECEFLQCDIAEFYPSISEGLLNSALVFAEKQGVRLAPTEREVILHARKTILMSENTTWAKNGTLFDVSMGAYDGAEVAELVGLLLLSEIETRLPNLNFGLYRDDGLAVYKTTKGIHIERTKKKLHKIFNEHGLKIEAEFRLHTVDYLDVTLDLHSNTFKPFRKPNDIPTYINTQSNHPPHIIKEIPRMIASRLSSISSNEKTFEEAKPIYCQALRDSGYNTAQVTYKQQQNTKTRNKSAGQKKTPTVTTKQPTSNDNSSLPKPAPPIPYQPTPPPTGPHPPPQRHPSTAPSQDAPPSQAAEAPCTQPMYLHGRVDIEQLTHPYNLRSNRPRQGQRMEANRAEADRTTYVPHATFQPPPSPPAPHRAAPPTFHQDLDTTNLKTVWIPPDARIEDQTGGDAWHPPLTDPGADHRPTGQGRGQPGPRGRQKVSGVDDNVDNHDEHTNRSSDCDGKKTKGRKRKRNIIWYNPPYNASMTTDFGKQFLQLIDRHFPKDRQDNLQKIFNRNSLKISYRTTPNMKSIINAHNTKILAEHNKQSEKQEAPCNCRGQEAKAECPLEGKCQGAAATTVVYKATVETNTDTKTYIGSTEGTFKKRYYGHKSDFKHEAKRNSTTLSHYIWDCKDRGETPKVKWEIVKKCNRYRCGTRKCDVCLAEKLEILKERGRHCLNKRSELMRPCPHRRKFRLSNLKDT